MVNTETAIDVTHPTQSYQLATEQETFRDQGDPDVVFL